MLTALPSSGPAIQVEVTTSEVRGEGSKRYVEYTVKVQTTLPIFELSESIVHRRYSQFEWLQKELERSSAKMLVPPIPDKAWQRQLPFFGKKDDQFQEEFIEERRRGLEEFINKVAEHPLVQNERALHVFLFDAEIDLSRYIPGKVK